MMKKGKKDTKDKPVKLKKNLFPHIFKAVVFIFSSLILVSLFTSKNNIFNDFNMLQDTHFTFGELFSANILEISNPVGIIGAFLSYHTVKIFGHIFSIIALSMILIKLVLNFAGVVYNRLNYIFLFLLTLVINLYVLNFYFMNHLYLYYVEFQDKMLFECFYNLIFSLVGRAGTLIFCFISFVLSLRLIISFNPFKMLVTFIKYLWNMMKKKEEYEVEDEEETLPEYGHENPIEYEKNPIEENLEEELEQQINYLEEIIYQPPKIVPKDITNDHKKYQKPDIDSFLYKPSKDKRVDKDKLNSEIKAVSQMLMDKLAEFGIEASVLNVNVGPIITQYELEPAPGIKVNRFTSLSDDLALALKAKSIRVQAPIPGRGLIGVEVPNKNADIIYMRDIFFSNEMNESNAILSVALGKDIAGRPIVTDLAKTPHLLIAGATGSGKSVCINTIICSLLLRCTPEEVRIVMIDPKRIELSGYEGIPHLIQSVVTESDEAMNTLTWAVYEMERRYELLQELKVRDIISYNHKIEEMVKNGEAEEIDKLPYIVLIVDEFADLIMTAGREIELPIARLAQMARAIGIHIILATQRPSIKVITGVIKANFPARIAFRVSSKVDSRVILDSTGADKLLGRGDMLFLPPGKPNPERIHGAYLGDSEIEGLVEYLRTQPKPKLDIQMSKPEVGNIYDFEYDDDLFPESAKVVVSTGMASVSMLQRHFKIGYARAGRLIDLLERAGVIGPHLGSKPREVLMSKEDIEGFQN